VQHITEWFKTSLNLNSELQTRLLGSSLIILVIWLLRLLTNQFVSRRTEDVRIRYRRRKATATERSRLDDQRYRIIFLD
jgi:hypothetical protein